MRCEHECIEALAGDVVAPGAGERQLGVAALSQSQAPRRASRFCKLALLAVRRLAGQPWPERLGLIVGTALGPHESTSQVHNDMMDFGDAEVSPTAFSHSVHNVAAAYIAQTFGIRGPCLTVTDFEDAQERCRQLAGCWLAEDMCDGVLVVLVDEMGFVFDRIEAELGQPFAGVQEKSQAWLLTKKRNGMKKLTEQEIVETVNGIFKDVFELSDDKLTPDAQLFDDLGLDSLDAVDMVANLQERFGVSLRNDERIRAVRTLADIYKLVATMQDELGAK